MNYSTECPTPATLAKLCQGQIDDVLEASLAAHIDGCLCCQEALASIQRSPTDPIVCALRSPAAADLSVEETGCRVAVRRAAAIAAGASIPTGARRMPNGGPDV